MYQEYQIGDIHMTYGRGVYVAWQFTNPSNGNWSPVFDCRTSDEVVAFLIGYYRFMPIKNEKNIHCGFYRKSQAIHFSAVHVMEVLASHRCVRVDVVNDIVHLRARQGLPHVFNWQDDKSLHHAMEWLQSCPFICWDCNEIADPQIVKVVGKIERILCHYCAFPF